MIRLDHVELTYPDTSSPALRDVSLEVEAGELALLVGPSGSGKSTLLRLLNGLVPHFTGGRLRGRIEVAGRSPAHEGPAAMGSIVGIVFQDPEAQFVVERVEDEVAFALENRAMPREEMLRRVDRALRLLDLERLRDRTLATLSGGEKQRVAIAAALALEPRVLVLDEPTSQLDPDAADEVLEAVRRLSHELGLTVLLAEHRLERVLHLADRLLYVEDGRVRSGRPRDLIAELPLAPPVATLARALGWHPIPLSVAEAAPLAASLAPPAVGSRWSLHDGRTPPRLAAGAAVAADEPPPYGSQPGTPAHLGRLVLRASAVTFVHPTSGAGLRGVDLALREGEIVALMGPNGSGKTTLLRCIVGLLRPSAGSMELNGRSILGLPTASICREIGYLPQAPDDLLFAETVSDELTVTLRNHGLLASPPIDPALLLASLGLADEAQSYPRDLSVGQRQRVAFGAIAVTRPRVLLLDEPTRGMDYRRKAELADLLRAWRDQGTAILLVTHDVELAATLVDRVVRLENGAVTADGPPSDHLHTQIAQLFPGTGWLTLADALAGLAAEPATL